VSKYVTMIGQDDAPHLNPPVISAEEREELFADMEEHEREARETGKPSLGAGAIYPIPEKILFIDPVPIPDWWEFGYALDPGWNVTAAILGARNPDTGQHYLVAEYYGQRDKPIIHAAGIKAMLPWPELEGCIDPAGDNVGSQKDGSKMKQEYEDQGLLLMKANNAVHAGLRHCLVEMQQGTLKVFNTLVYFKKEIRLYRRNEKGKIVKENDHALDCMRYLMNTDGAFQPRPIPRNRAGRGSGGEW
jgi:hypothetical protein